MMVNSCDLDMEIPSQEDNMTREASTKKKEPGMLNICNLSAFFLFLYTAKVPNNFSQLALSILPIAVYFSCEELIGKCELDLVSNLASDNVVTVLDVARRQFRDHLQYKAAKFIKVSILILNFTIDNNNFVIIRP